MNNETYQSHDDQSSDDKPTATFSFTVDFELLELHVNGKFYADIDDTLNYRILDCLSRYPNKVCSEGVLRYEAWHDPQATTQTVNRQIRRLRKLLRDIGLTFIHVKKVPGGYTLRERINNGNG